MKQCGDILRGKNMHKIQLRNLVPHLEDLIKVHLEPEGQGHGVLSKVCPATLKYPLNWFIKQQSFTK